MKALFIALLAALGGTSALAGTIDRDVQAVITHPQFPQAMARARAAVERLNGNFEIMLGETSTVKMGSPVYYHYIPVFAVRVPLSPEPHKQVGSIVSGLIPGLNAPVPYVESVFFKPMEEPAGN